MMTDVDVAVIGTGFAGLAALHLLRERGLRVHAFDEAGNVGGTWWWHAFPGSHLDTEGHLYQYFFSEELYRDWGWSERHPAGYEVQRWLRFVADRLDLRRDISLATRVVAARPGPRGWTLTTDRGGTAHARHLVACTGRLPAEPDVDVSAFAGLVVRTAAWPEDGHDLSGRRVGVLGTTVATVQLAPWIADTAGALTVVSDGPRDVVRRSNPVFGWRERDDYRSRFGELRAEPPAVEAWAADREAMRARVADPGLVANLVPDGEAGRVALDDGWLELFTRPDVALVDRDAVARVGTAGLELTDGTRRDLDVVVVPDEFDDGPPALWGIDGVTADAPGLHCVVAPPGGGTVSFELMRRVEEAVGSVLAEVGAR